MVTKIKDGCSHADFLDQRRVRTRLLLGDGDPIAVNRHIDVKQAILAYTRVGVGVSSEGYRSKGASGDRLIHVKDDALLKGYVVHGFVTRQIRCVQLLGELQREFQSTSSVHLLWNGGHRKLDLRPQRERTQQQSTQNEDYGFHDYSPLLSCPRSIRR
jgi:hypothetical protein